MEEYRLQYPLTASSLVLDAGAYRGDFIDWCRTRWGCTVLAFEPCTEFADSIARRFASDIKGPPCKVGLHRFGLSGRTEQVTLSIHGDSTSVFAMGDGGGATEQIELRDVAEVFAGVPLHEVDLFKINIEGGEYPLLDRMIETGLVERVKYFQIQYHGFGAPDPAAARDKIRAALEATHREEWCVNGGQWESWARR